MPPAHAAAPPELPPGPLLLADAGRASARGILAGGVLTGVLVAWPDAWF